MDNNLVCEYILRGEAVLITGSGANVGVTNHNNEDFPTGKKITKEIYKECGILDPEDEYDLQDASQTYLEYKTAPELIAFLKSILNVGNLSDSARMLYNLPWLRVYTTNYDDVPLLASEGDCKNLPVTINESPKNYLTQSNICVYINGYIGNLNEKTLDSQFKLTSKSYMAEESLLNSRWGNVIKNDLEIARCVIIVGLSLDYDLELKKLIFNKNIKEKTIFIESQNISDYKQRKMERIGLVRKIGLEEFTKEIYQYRQNYFTQETLAKRTRLNCFIKNSRRNTLTRAKNFDIYNLFMSGEVCNELFFKNEEGSYESLIYRNKVDMVTKAMKDNLRLIFIHANLGNGKGIFLEILKQRLYDMCIETFSFSRANNKKEISEIDSIMKNPEKKVIIIENYFNHLDILKIFSEYNCENVFFVLTARTMIYETKLVEVCDYFELEAGMSKVIDINKLDDKEIGKFIQILDVNGFWGKNTALKQNEKFKRLKKYQYGNAEMQTILIDIIHSTEMRNKLVEVVNLIKNESGGYYIGLIMMLVSKVMSLELTVDDINGIMGVNYLSDPLYTTNVAIKELVVFKNNGKEEFKIKSSIIAKEILHNLEDGQEIISALTKVALYANMYCEDNKFDSVLKNIASFSHVNSFLGIKRDNLEFILDYYDELKHIEYFKDNSFFWLQYSIACLSYQEYKLAQVYVDVAYAKFRKNRKTVPFQCDNQQAKIYLELIKSGKSSNLKQDLIEAHKLIMKPIKSKKDREENAIRLMFFYKDKKFAYNLNEAGLLDLYVICCREACNKLTNFLKTLKNERDKQRYESLKNQLFKIAISIEERINLQIL